MGKLEREGIYRDEKGNLYYIVDFPGLNLFSCSCTQSGRTANF